MLECIILGDSIAVGTAMYRKECIAYADGGYNSAQWNNKYANRDLTANTVIISLGSNDAKYINSEQELRKMRSRVTSKRVYWLMPSIKPGVQSIVEKIAKEYDDMILAVPPKDLQRDGVHPLPTWYRFIAGYTK